MGKKALLVGINTYTRAPLRGCVNDILAVEDVLRNTYGFNDITMLADNNATTDAIRKCLDDLVTGCHPGDVVYFHYSGHGSQVYDSKYDNDVEVDGLDEIICPVDLNWQDKMITDDELKSIFDKVPSGVNLTVTLDCCNSGGAMDHDNQYQALGEANEITKEEGRYLTPPPGVLTPFAEDRIGFKPKALSRNVNATALMITGCQSHQTSADAYIDGKFMGACTYYLVKNIKDNPATNYKELVDSINTDMVKFGFTQRPELNGPESLFAKPYLKSYVEADLGSIPVFDEPVEGIQIAPSPEKGKTKWIIGGVLAVAVIAIMYALS